MSVYTTELRYIFDAYAGSEKATQYTGVENLLEQYVGRLFNFDFPFYGNDEERKDWEKRFCRHFWTREIGEETVGLWKLKLHSTLDSVMPKYNSFYLAAKNGVNLYDNISIKRTEKISKTGSDVKAASGVDVRESDVKSTDNTKSKYSDTPQGGLTGLENDDYLSSAKIDEIVGTNKTTETTTLGNKNTTTYGTVDTHEYSEQGFNGNKSLGEMLELSQKIAGIDGMLWKELEPLFIQLW